MKAVVCKEWGKPDTLVIEEIESPPLGADDIRIGVHACGLNFADTLMIQGRYQVKPPFPFSPGLEAAGEVLEVGANVTRFKIGDRVAALCGHGGFAEEVVVPAAVALTIPDTMPYTDAAAFTVAYGTSHVALEHRGRLQPGEVLLVHGAAGGVGLTAVEIGKLMGATVIATASTAEKLAVAQKYGADHLINYREEDFRTRVKELTGGKGADVIYDPVGGDVFDQSIRCINWEGRLLVIGFAAGRIPQLPANMALIKNMSVVGVFWGAYAQRDPVVLVSSLKKLMGWYAEGKLKPHVSKTFPLEETAEAMNFLLQRKSKGKVVVVVKE
ncbi:MAG: NADPH:quinone oxidoreductase family protein [Chloroflexota bacterium]